MKTTATEDPDDEVDAISEIDGVRRVQVSVRKKSDGDRILPNLALLRAVLSDSVCLCATVLE